MSNDRWVRGITALMYLAGLFIIGYSLWTHRVLVGVAAFLAMWSINIYRSRKGLRPL